MWDLLRESGGFCGYQRKQAARSQTSAACRWRMREPQHVICITVNRMESRRRVIHSACCCGFFLSREGLQPASCHYNNQHILSRKQREVLTFTKHMRSNTSQTTATSGLSDRIATRLLVVLCSDHSRNPNLNAWRKQTVSIQLQCFTEAIQAYSCDFLADSAPSSLLHNNLAAQQQYWETFSQTTFQDVDGWRAVRSRDSPSSRGGRKSPPEISLLEQRTRLILCQGDTIYHGVISLAQREGTQAEWDVW